jgi:hypothetical protein
MRYTHYVYVNDMAFWNDDDLKSMLARFSDADR